jgi:hypothetical protein
MDKTLLTAFCDYAIGDRLVGGAVNDPAGTPHSPELRALIVGMLGDNMPLSAIGIVECRSISDVYARQAKAFATLLREVADGLDPPPRRLS